MPRPKKEGAPEPKKRSRTGCWPCKARKVKCGEERPFCSNCQKHGEQCDYSIKLNWGGRSKQGEPSTPTGGTSSPFQVVFPGEQVFNPSIPSPPTGSAFSQSPPIASKPQHRSRPNTSSGLAEAQAYDPRLTGAQTQTSSPITNHARRKSGGHNGQRDSQALSGEQERAAYQSAADMRLQGTQFRNSFEYPSPAITNTESSSYGNTTVVSPIDPSAMGPPLRPISADPANSPGHRTKRLRLSPSVNSPALSPAIPSKQEYMYDRTGMQFQDVNFAASSGNFSPYVTTPLTPGSSIGSEGRHGSISAIATSHGSSDPRRLSVSSLLSAPEGDGNGPKYPMSDQPSGYTTYGYDLGQLDEDIPKNDDATAIAIFSPSATYRHKRPQEIAFERGGYYANPVPITIPKRFDALPPRLKENPMNLLYFHHFLNHTARILIPHDCAQNPFRHILPAMALQDDNILNLLLAFSASHRARLLNQDEPANRIALWVQDVFPKLRRALTDPNETVSTANLAAAIMLASLEIVCPNTFEVPISWQDHLALARQMIIARGGRASLQYSQDQSSYFLSRWFAYLDVLGSLSGSKNDEPMGSEYWMEDDTAENPQDDEIDCLLGFTSRCTGILAKIAALAKRCEPERIDEQGNLRPGWKPSEDVRQQAERLREELQDARLRVSKRACAHCVRRDSVEQNGNGNGHHNGSISNSMGEGSERSDWDSREIYATNEAFHWAGLLHLLRRVLGHSSSSVEVQHAVKQVLYNLAQVRKGSTADSCLLFPMFAAGCDAIEKEDRRRIMERMEGVEGFGMGQIKRARRVLLKVWETGRAWEGVVEGEFFG